VGRLDWLLSINGAILIAKHGGYCRGKYRKYAKGYWPNGRKKKFYKGHKKVYTGMKCIVNNDIEYSTATELLVEFIPLRVAQ